MLDIATHTHYLPDEWIDRAHTRNVQNEFFSLYRYKALLWINEALGIILAPLVMIFFLPRNAEGIIQFFRDYTIEQDNLPMCRFASFDFKELGNKDYSPNSNPVPERTERVVPPPRREFKEYEKKSKKREDKSIRLTGTQSIPTLFRDTRRRDDKRNESLLGNSSTIQIENDIIELRPDEQIVTKPSKYGKMELSLLNFRTSYPKWIPSNDLQHDIDQFFGDLNSSSVIQGSSINLPDDSSLYFKNSSYGVSSSLILNRNFQIEREEAEKELLPRSLLVFSSERIVNKNPTHNHL